MHIDTNLYRHGAIAGGLFLLFGEILSAQVGLGLSPMRLELKMAPGTQSSGVLTLSSDSTDKVRVRADLLDFLIDQNQTPQFERVLPTEAGFSCRDWMSVNPMEVEIASGKQVSVRYTVRVPAGADLPRGYHCAVGFTTLPTSSQIGGTGIKTAVQVVSAFYVTLGTPGIEVGFKEIKLSRSAEPDNPHWNGELVLQNFSLTHCRPVGELSVLDNDGRVLESVLLTPLPVLPSRSQRYIVPFAHDLAPGTYKLRARVDFGRNEIEEGTAVVLAEHQ